MKPTASEMTLFAVACDGILPKVERATAAVKEFPTGKVPATVSGALIHMSDWLTKARSDQSIDALLKAERFADVVLGEMPPAPPGVRDDA